MRMRRTTAVGLATAALLLPLATGCSDSDGGGGSSSGPIKFGMAVPMSGPIAFVGENLEKGAKVAIEAINDAGGIDGREIELYVEDTEGNAQGATAAVEKLLNSDRVDALIGPTSAEIMSVLARVKASGVPAIAVGSTSALDDQLGTTVFRTGQSDSQVGPVLSHLAIKDGYDRCAIVVDALEGGQAVKANIENAYPALGGELTGTFDLAAGQQSYRSEIAKLVAEKPECVFLEVDPEVAIRFWQNASEFPELADTHFIATDFALSDDSFKAFAPVDGTIDMQAVAGAGHALGSKAFAEYYSSTFPEDDAPVLFADLAYDAVNVLSLAMVAAGSTDHAKVADNIRDVSREGTECGSFVDCAEGLADGTDVNYEGARGSADIDDTGNGSSDFGVFQIEGGKSEEVATISKEEVADVLEQIG